ncbi:MAG: CHAT domain-containing protein [Snowella sp.]|nr:CHAT domain-containing protein [Snowella sp.]
MIIGIHHSLLSQTISPEGKADPVIQLEGRWQNQYNNYFQGDFSHKGLGATAIAQELLTLQQKTQKNPAVLWIAANSEKLNLYLIAPGKPLIHQENPEVNQAKLSPIIQSFLSEIVQNKPSEDYLILGKQLYDWLIAPIESELQVNKIDTLILCLGEGLRSLPLSALYDGKQFLIEKYSLTRIPGFNLSEIDQGKLRNAKVLAMGASKFEEQPALPGVAIELDTILDTPWEGRSVLNQGFTVNNLNTLRQSEPFQILHLATHASFQPGEPNQSYIQFSDRKLTLADLPELGLNQPPVELLVLSACQTAVGDKDVELGFSGLALQAGVKSALASFWSVSDAGTLALMSEFYQRLKTTLNKADALQQTQIAMIRRQVYLKQGELISSRGNVTLPAILSTPQPQDLSHPFYWAGFSLIGSPW